MAEPAISAVLFDLDGTLADTAPDLCGAANRLRQQRGLEPLPLGQLRPYTSQGVRGLLRAGLGITPEHPDYASLSERFLDDYAAHICDETRLFPGIPALLDHLDHQGIPWGVVTNKRTRFTQPLVELLRLSPRSPCIVSGDTTPEAKPSPLPLLHALKLLQRPAAAAYYIGDDLRDVQAGRAAGMRTAVVRYGYLGDELPPEQWGADLLVDHALDLIPHLSRT